MIFPYAIVLGRNLGPLRVGSGPYQLTSDFGLKPHINMDVAARRVNEGIAGPRKAVCADVVGGDPETSRLEPFNQC